jgi:hypothetical protein
VVGVIASPVITPLLRPLLRQVLVVLMGFSGQVRRLAAEVREDMEDAAAEAAAKGKPKAAAPPPEGPRGA